MKKTILLFLVLMFSSVSEAQMLTEEQMFAEIQASHIKGNVPQGKNFEKFLKRDLKNHFKKDFKGLTEISYDLLRKEATQSGVAYPKFYAWIIIRSSSGILASGAVRLAAIDKVKFEVTDFLNKSVMVSKPSSIDEIFPMALVDPIKKQAGIK